MRYIVFSEWSSEEYDKAIREKGNAIGEERIKYPNRYPKQLLKDQILMGDLPTLTKTIKSFTIYETDDPEQIHNIVAFWTLTPSIKRWFIPIADGSNITKAWEKMKK